MTKLEEILTTRDPFELFKQWFATAHETKDIREPTAMTLATANAFGQPRARTVLLKNYSKSDGFIFFTNYQSRKGHDLNENPMASLLFYWDPLFRQIIIQGRVSPISREESVAYWNSRPRDSQLAGYLSKQSEPVIQPLDLEFEKLKTEMNNKPIPCPENWGGFRLTPSTFEFWLGHKFRLHDRVEFNIDGTAWNATQLYP